MNVKLTDEVVITSEDENALGILRHSTSHLMAEAIMNLFPDAKVAIGPSVNEGFYYDIEFSKPLSTEDLPLIEKEMHRLLKTNRRIEKLDVSKEEALKMFSDNPYKTEIISSLDEGTITLYKQGDFVDLCRGPHLFDTHLIKYFSLTSVAGAYWRGDSNNIQLTRIYGTAFFTSEDLANHLRILEERKKRDHRLLGAQLGLFMFSEHGPGFPFFLPNGMIVYNKLIEYWSKFHKENGYELIQTPVILNKDLWMTSGHWDNYHENMYTTMIDEREFVVKPMNCPGAMLVYRNSLHSYRDLPLRLAEIGLVHRHEASGALAGLFRVRSFHQDDAHIFVRKDQLHKEIMRIIQIFIEVYRVFGLTCHVELSTRPEKKYIGDIKVWNYSEKILEKAIQKSGLEYKINPGDGAFYGPKIDFKITDSMLRVWQCGTIQMDMNLPERFDIFYINENNEHERPIMLHRALFGSIERFMGIIIEHFGGAFPLWLAPQQLHILPVNDEFHLKYAQKIEKLLSRKGITSVVVNSDEKLGYRLREAQTKKIPYSIVLGDQEVANETVTYRKYGEREQITVPLKDFLKLLETKIKNKSL